MSIKAECKRKRHSLPVWDHIPMSAVNKCLWFLWFVAQNVNVCIDGKVKLGERRNKTKGGKGKKKLLFNLKSPPPWI